MTRIELACFGLIASAFVLAAVLVTNLGANHTNRAQADMVVRADGVTLMTARTRRGEEGLFLLDNATQRLLIYRTAAPPRGAIQLVGGIDLRDMFAGGGAGIVDENDEEPVQNPPTR